MSIHIPFDIQTEVIKRLVAKSLIKFRSVSKTWKSLIDSRKFVASYGIDHIRMHRLLVSNDSIYMSFVDDDDTFFFGQTIVPVLPIELDNVRILGSSHGLFCLHCTPMSYTSYKGMFVIWNPIIRKSVGIEEPNSFKPTYTEVTEVGFGVCPVTRDPKVVRITTRRLNWLVEIYSLTSGSWRQISNNLPRGTIEFNPDRVVVTDRIIYWDAFESTGTDDLIVSFDLTSEEFTVVDIPDSIAHHGYEYVLSKLRDSLVLLHYSNAQKPVCDVWMMNNGVSKTFTKLYNIKPPNLLPRGVKGFTKSGTPIIELGDDDKSDGLYVFEPNSKRISKIQINGAADDVMTYYETLLLRAADDVMTYYETLLLLDR